MRQWPTKGFPLDYQLISQKKFCSQEGIGKKYSKWWKARVYNLNNYPAKLSFRIEGQIKCFPNKVKLKDIIITKPLYEMLKELI